MKYEIFIKNEKRSPSFKGIGILKIINLQNIIAYIKFYKLNIGFDLILNLEIPFYLFFEND
jgi:hypothetical protein